MLQSEFANPLDLLVKITTFRYMLKEFVTLLSCVRKDNRKVLYSVNQIRSFLYNHGKVKKKDTHTHDKHNMPSLFVVYSNKKNDILFFNFYFDFTKHCR